MAAFTLATSMVIQRYGLACIPGEEGWLLKKVGQNGMWGIGIGFYGLGNVFYVVGLWWTPLSLASALVATLLVFNTILSRIFLKSVITYYDYVGNGLILLAVVIIATFGPTPDQEAGEGEYSPQDLANNAGMVLGALYLTALILFVVICIGMVRKFEATYPHFGNEDKVELHEQFSEQIEGDLARNRTRTVTKLEEIKFPSFRQVTKMQLVYPAVLGTFESLVQVALKAYSGFLVLAAKPTGNSTLGDAFDTGEGNGDWSIMTHWAAWIMLVLLAFATAMTLMWLHKVYSHFETTDCLPIEYGVVTSFSVLGGLCFYREYEYCGRISIGWDIAMITFAIGLIGLGCYVLCFLKPSMNDAMLEEMLVEAGAVDAEGKSKKGRRSKTEDEIALAAPTVRDGFFRRSFPARMASLQGIGDGGPSPRSTEMRSGDGNLAARLGVGAVVNKREQVAPQNRMSRAGPPVPSIRLYRYHSNMKIVQSELGRRIISGASAVKDGVTSAGAAVVNTTAAAGAAVVNTTAAVGSRVRSFSHDLGDLLPTNPMQMARQLSPRKPNVTKSQANEDGAEVSDESRSSISGSSDGGSGRASISVGENGSITEGKASLVTVQEEKRLSGADLASTNTDSSFDSKHDKVRAVEMRNFQSVASSQPPSQEQGRRKINEDTAARLGVAMRAAGDADNEDFDLRHSSISHI
jgi:hypothetical protein